MGLDEELHRERLERKDGGIEGHAEGDDIPVAHAKLEEIGEDDLVGGGFAQMKILLRERLERKDGGIEGHAEGDDIPVAHAKLEEIGEDDLVGGGFAQMKILLR